MSPDHQFCLKQVFKDLYFNFSFFTFDNLHQHSISHVSTIERRFLRANWEVFAREAVKRIQIV